MFCNGSPVAVSHTLTVRSQLAATRCLLSGLNATRQATFVLFSVSRLMQAAHFFLCFCAKVSLKIVRQTSTKVKKYGDSQEKGTDLHGGMRCVWPARRNGWTACPSLRCT